MSTSARTRFTFNTVQEAIDEFNEVVEEYLMYHLSPSLTGTCWKQVTVLEKNSVAHSSLQENEPIRIPSMYIHSTPKGYFPSACFEDFTEYPIVASCINGSWYFAPQVVGLPYAKYQTDGRIH